MKLRLECPYRGGEVVVKSYSSVIIPPKAIPVEIASMAYLNHKNRAICPLQRHLAMTSKIEV